VSITITEVIDNPPVADDESFTVAEGGTATEVNLDVGLSLLDGDTDVDTTDTQTASVGVGPDFGEVTVNPDGTFSYTHDDSENLTDSFTYIVTDSGGLTGTGTVNITITPVNDNSPVGTLDLLTLDEGETLIDNLLSNDTDIDQPGDTLTVIDIDGNPASVGVAIVLPSGAGTVTVNADGTVTFVSSGAEVFSDSFTYSIFDGVFTINDIPVNITVNPVNDNAPTASTIPDIEVDEDAGNTLVVLNGYFNDVDIDADGELDADIVSDNDSLVFTVTSSNGTLATLSIDVANLTLDYQDNQFGTSTITVTATDEVGHQVSTDFTLTVNSVNDTPVYQAGSYSNLVVDEDAPPIFVALDSAFEDLDLLDGNPGDETLTYTLTITEIPYEFTVTQLLDVGGLVTTWIDDEHYIIETTDSSVTLPLVADAHGAVDITVRATDLGRPPASPADPIPLFAEESFSITINAVDDDVPVAVDDGTAAAPFMTIPEDSGAVDILVLLNDDAGDVPARVVSAGQTIVANGVTKFYRSSSRQADLLNEGNSITTANGEVTCANCPEPSGDSTIFGTGMSDFAVKYKPAAEFNGLDSFDYCMRDSVGDDESCATVYIEVTPVNDPPQPISDIVYQVNQASDLVANVTQGLRSTMLDVDNTHIDGFGCDPLDPLCAPPASDPQPDTLYFQFVSATTDHGQLLPPFLNDGSFAYRPDATFAGNDSFLFDVCDRPFATATADNCLYGVAVNIVVSAVSGAPVGSSDEVVEFDYQMSQTPLELPVGPEPNVMIVMDDSGSMDWDILTDQEKGVYWYETGDNVYYANPATAGYRGVYGVTNVAPTEKTVPGIGLWRLRNSNYNTVYYNPAVNYLPWKGLVGDNEFYPDSVPTAARHNPLTETPVTDLTTEISYVGRAPYDGTTCGWVCNKYKNGACNEYKWRCRTGFSFRELTSDDVYIPRYYAWEDKNGNGLLDATPSPDTDPDNSEGTLVEIRATDSGGDPILYPKGTDRNDCSTLVDSCTYTEELQNFANWFTYARNRELTAKWSLGQVISGAENLRVGYGLLNNELLIRPITTMNTSDRTGAKAGLLDAIYATNPAGGTPLRQALYKAGRYFECKNSNSMGTNASSPGDADCPVLAAPEGNCQQNFALVFSDGTWSGPSPGVGNRDGDNDTAFDGGMYAHSFTQSLADIAMHFYERDLHSSLDNEVPTTGRDRGGAPSGSFSTANDARMFQHMTTYTVGFGVNGLVTDAMVPTDYTQAFDWGDPTDAESKVDDLRHAAVNGRGEYLSAADAASLTDVLVSAFEEFAQGSGAASAVSFNSQEVQEDLLIFRAFYNTKINTGDLIAQELTVGETIVISEPVWRSAQRMDLVSFDDREIITFDPSANVGIPFRADDLNSDQRDAFIDDPTATLTDDEKDTQVENKINYLRGDTTNERPAGSYRERPSVEGRLGDIVHSTPVFIGPPNRENRDAPPFPQDETYREWQGESGIYDRQKLLYVTANDGMLHAFNADNGDEHFAFVPNNLMVSSYGRKITELLNYEYSHRYFVDLTAAINDVYIDSDDDGDKEWATVLVGGHGAGSKAYFALDITDPEVLNEEDADEVVLWEFTDADDTYPTTTTGNVAWLTQGTPLVNGDGTQKLDLLAAPKPIKDLGYSFTVPTLVLSNKVDSGSGENEWISIFGNGYNSTSGIAKLYILFIEKGVDGTWCHPDMVYNNSLTPAALPAECVGEQDFIKLNTGFGVPASGPRAGYPNGLGTPRGIDTDGNGTIDYAYAGDTLGNLFRFDLTSSDPADWEVVKIFEAKYVDPVTSAETPQPISSQPIVLENKQAGEGYIVLFGTGSYITVPDGSDTNIQSLYGIWDRLGPVLIDKDDLVRQKFTNVYDPDFGFLRRLSNEAVNYSSSGTMGWYNDLSAVPVGGTEGVSAVEFPGERAIRNIQLHSGLGFVNSIIPRSATSCVSIAGGFALSFCPASGGSGCLNGEGVFDLNDDGEIDELDATSDDEGYDGVDNDNDGEIDEEDERAELAITGKRFEDAVPTDSSFIGNARITQLSDKSLDSEIVNEKDSNNTGRLSWKQLIDD
jgi:type IV pilus assembly protein PilY1